MASKWAREQSRKKRTDDLNEFIKSTGYEFKWYTPYHVRIWMWDAVVDFFPTNGRYHDLARGRFKSYDDYEDLCKVASEAEELSKVNTK